MTELSWLCFKFSSSPSLSHGQTQWDSWGWAERGEEGEAIKGGHPRNRSDLSDERGGPWLRCTGPPAGPHTTWPLPGRPPQLYELYGTPPCLHGLLLIHCSIIHSPHFATDLYIFPCKCNAENCFSTTANETKAEHSRWTSERPKQFSCMPVTMA